MNLTFTCYGEPKPQGSTRAFVVNGRAVTTSDNKALRPWRDSLAAAARTALALDPCGCPWQGPVAVDVVFYLPRPKSRPKRDLHPDRRPDLDKLLRGLLDALTGPVVRDDAQVVVLTSCKRYAGPDAGLNEPGAVVTVRPLNVTTAPEAPDAVNAPNPTTGDAA